LWTVHDWLSVSNPRCGLDGAQVNSHTTNKINEVIHYTHVQVLQKCSKFHDLLLFGKLTWRGTTFLVHTFPFGVWIMMNFEVEVGEIVHSWNISEYKVKWSLFPRWITFFMSFKWKCCLHKRCISLIPIQLGHKFETIWIIHEGVMDFRSWGKLLAQWWWPKLTYNVFSWHMPLQVEFYISQRLKVGEDILSFIMKLVWPSYHKYWASYGSWKLCFHLGHGQNDL
jgi:hypothetical protein